MRLRSAWSEGWRNVTSGAARTVITSIGIGLVASAVILIELSAAGRVLGQARTFEAAGASTWVLSGIQVIDPVACDGLADFPGVVASGALRTSGAVTLRSMPAQQLAVFQVSPGFPAVFGVQLTSGLLVSSPLAERLGILDEGSVVIASGARVTVNSLLPYPTDGRSPKLENAFAEIVDPRGWFDECWVRLADPDNSDREVAYFALRGGTDLGDFELRQHNDSMGRSYDVPQELSALPSLWTVAGGALLGGLLGGALTMSRRLVIAGNRQVGVLRPALIIGSLTEGAFAVGLAFLLTVLPISLVVLALFSIETTWFALAIAGRAFAACASASLIGMVAATGYASAPRRLYKYFRDR